MPRRSIYLLVALAIGCTHTADELRREGVHIEFNTSLAPQAAAGCIARHIEGSVPRFCAPLAVAVREREKPQTYELVVAAGGGFGLYGIVEPADSRSIATLSLHPRLCHTVGGIRGAIEAGCR
jgi:hypothetical protein